MQSVAGIIGIHGVVFKDTMSVEKSTPTNNASVTVNDSYRRLYHRHSSVYRRTTASHSANGDRNATLN
jgi:hypothetical protein